MTFTNGVIAVAGIWGFIILFGFVMAIMIKLTHKAWSDD